MNVVVDTGEFYHGSAYFVYKGKSWTVLEWVLIIFSLIFSFRYCFACQIQIQDQTVSSLGYLMHNEYLITIFYLVIFSLFYLILNQDLT